MAVTPVFLPGKVHGQRRLANYRPWGCKELDTTEHACTIIILMLLLVFLVFLIYLHLYKFSVSVLKSSELCYFLLYLSYDYFPFLEKFSVFFGVNINLIFLFFYKFNSTQISFVIFYISS